MRKLKQGTIAILAVGLTVGTTFGVAAQEEPSAPHQFTGRISFGACIGSEMIESAAGRTRTLSAGNGRFCQPAIVEPFSDPRLRGQPYVWQNNDAYADGPMVFATAFSIVNDEGAWRGVPDVFLDEAASGNQILVGEGAYEGLVAIATADLVGDVWEWHGWIIEGDLPPMPEEPAGIP